MFKIEVYNMGRGTRSHILASCKVRLTSEDGAESVSMFDARVMRNRNGQFWVAWPNQYVREADQSEKYVPILVFSDKLERRIADAVLTEYESYRTTSTRPGVPCGR
jgi:DNA-binding cell septation regulator SpoVG